MTIVREGIKLPSTSNASKEGFKFFFGSSSSVYKRSCKSEDRGQMKFCVWGPTRVSFDILFRLLIINTFLEIVLIPLIALKTINK